MNASSYRQSIAPAMILLRHAFGLVLWYDFAFLFNWVSNLSKQYSNKRGIYLLPNLLTTSSLFAAFYSIVATMNLQFEQAVIAIFIGMIADGFDGRVARLTNTQSDFGAEYDSLSDMVTFGVAPALLAYRYGLINLGKIGWLVAFTYTASVALRLARFNTQLETADKRYFQGLACPAGAAVITSLIWLCTQYELHGGVIRIVLAVASLIIAVLMVSNIRYSSFKKIDFKGKIPFFYVLLVVLIFVGIAAYPALVLFVGFCLYAVSGPLFTLAKLHKMKKIRKIRNKRKNK